MAGGLVSYKLIRSNRKTLVLQIIEDSVVVKAPMTMSVKEIEGFIAEKENWIRKHLDNPVKKKQKKCYQDGDTIKIYGNEYILSLCEMSRADRDSISLVDEKLCITAGKITQELIEELLAIWCKKAGLYYFIVAITKYASNMNVDFGRISIKDQKTRWGSCSSKNNLNFNWRLLLMPPEILDYVVVHELVHLIEMNHSKDFWKIVEKEMPDYEIRRQWLQKHGNEFM